MIRPLAGKLIVICGIDGSGKTTLEDGIVAALTRNGIPNFVTKQPSDFYRSNVDVREFLDSGRSKLTTKSIALFAAADRMIHIEKEIVPRLQNGEWVICGRYVYSTYAYFKERNVGMEFLRQINQDVPTPDYGILLDIPAKISLESVRRRDGDKCKFEERNVQFMERVRHNLLREFPSGFLVLDSQAKPEVLLRKSLSYLGVN